MSAKLQIACIWSGHWSETISDVIVAIMSHPQTLYD